MTGLYDSFQRPINYLRISVTDRCNLRCIYCMPEEGVKFISHDGILTYDEIIYVAMVAASLGINKIRLTGGEPLVRKDLAYLVNKLAEIEGIDDISMTTNGTLLKKYAAMLKSAGLKRVNISLDTLDPKKFRFITRDRGMLRDVLNGMDAARTANLNPIKINMVVMAGINDNEIIEFAKKTINDGWHVRFIEIMPFNRTPVEGMFIPLSTIKKQLEEFGQLEPCHIEGNGPAKYFRFRNAPGTVGFITPISAHFCLRCNRLRLTADGKLRPCLLSDEEIDLKRILRTEKSSAGVQDLIKEAIRRKPLGHRLAEGYIPAGRLFSGVGG